MRFKSHKEFFDSVGEERVQTRFYCESRAEVTVEELYQHFKARFIEETQSAARESRIHSCDIPGCMSCGNPEED